MRRLLPRCAGGLLAAAIVGATSWAYLEPAHVLALVELVSFCR